MPDSNGKNGSGSNGHKLGTVATHPSLRRAAPPVASTETTSSDEALQMVQDFLEEDGWHPTQLEGKTIFRMEIAGKNGRIRGYAQVRGDLFQVIVYTVAPVNVPEGERSRVADFLTRANYGMRIGNFEMDFEDGEVRYKAALDFEGATLQRMLIRNLLYPAAHMMDRYLPGLLAVTFGGQSPEDAIAAIEGAATES